MKGIFSVLLAGFGLVSVASAAETPADIAPIKVGGYLDAQFKGYKDESRPADDNKRSGFIINDGAIYLSHAKGATDVFIDIPFQWAQQSEQAATAGSYTNDPDKDGATNDFILGGHKAQGWIGYSVGPTKFQLGQFDTPFGFEVNDAPEITFSTQGLLYTYALPVTHTGFMITHKLGQVTGRLIAANPQNQGSQHGDNSEFAAQVSWANDNYRAGAGYLTWAKYPSENRTLTEVLAGCTFGNFLLDLEYDALRDPTSSGTPARITAANGTGFLVQPLYNFSKEFALAARYEQTAKMASLYDVKQWTAGVQYNLSETLRVKADYTSGETQSLETSTTKTKMTLWAISAVYKL